MEIKCLIEKKLPEYKDKNGAWLPDITDRQRQVFELEENENKIKREMRNIQTGFIYIAYWLMDIRDARLYTVAYDSNGGKDCKDIYSYCRVAFDFSKTYVHNLLSIGESFSKVIDGVKMRTGLRAEYSEYGFSQLVELLGIPVEMHKYFNPRMTVKEMRGLKNGQKQFICGWSVNGTGGGFDGGKSIEIPTSELKQEISTSEQQENDDRSVDRTETDVTTQTLIFKKILWQAVLYHKAKDETPADFVNKALDYYLEHNYDIGSLLSLA